MMDRIREGEERYQRGDLFGARSSFEEVLAHDPDNPEALNDMGVVCLSLGRVVDAIVYFHRALKACPDHPEANENIKDCLLGRTVIRPPNAEQCIPGLSHSDVPSLSPSLIRRLNSGRPWRFAIVAYSDVERDPERRLRWGDHWFKTRLARALESLGHEVVEEAPDILVHLFGVPLRSLPKDTFNIVWIHSHPDLVMKEDIARYHEVFCLSPFFTEKISQWGIPVRVLFGATDFQPIPDARLEHEVVFVGNAKGRRGRKIIEDLGDLRSLPFSLEVWGEGWEGLLPRDFWKGLYYPNEELNRLYATSRVVLNDHHEDMRREGFINPRVLDVLASGGSCVSDYNPVIETVLPAMVPMYSAPPELTSTIVNMVRGSRWRTGTTSVATRRVATHTFIAVAGAITERIEKAAIIGGRFKRYQELRLGESQLLTASEGSEADQRSGSSSCAISRTTLAAWPNDLSQASPEKIWERKCLDLLGGTIQRPLFFVHHGFGGGATLYRDKLFREWLSRGRPVLMYLENFGTGLRVLELLCNQKQIQLRLGQKADVGTLVANFAFDEVFYNNAVSFLRPEGVPRLLEELKERSSARLTIAFHDFFPVCPSWNLLSHRGEYCGLPSIDICRHCLAINPHVLPNVIRDIDMWRGRWSRALRVADSLVFFSWNTAELVGKVYSMDSGKLEVKPHKVDHGPSRKPKLDFSGGLHIGVVGLISYPKGSQIVIELSRLVRKHSLPIRITVIGTLIGSSAPSEVMVTGPYKVTDLPDIIERTGANVFLIPSICPETFSYVTSELIEMRVPVCCFDLGAPSERVREYEHGLVIANMDVEAVLGQIIGFYEKLKGAKAYASEMRA